MLKLLKKIWTNKIFYVFLIYCIIYTPIILYKSSDKNVEAIITGIAIDKVDDNYEVSMLVFSPSPGGQGSKIILVTEDGKEIKDIFQTATFKLGKKVGLAHCDVVVISSEVAKTDLRQTLDYFIRPNNLTANAVLVQAENGKELLQSALDTQYLNDIGLKDLILTNERYVFSSESNIEKFILNYYDEVGISFLPFIEAKEDTSNAGHMGEQGSLTTSANSGSSQGGGESKGSAKKNIDYQGKVSIIKNGKFVRLLNKDEINAMNYISKKVDHNSLSIKNVDIDNLGKGDISVEVLNKSVFRNFKFINGTPVIKYDIIFYVLPEQIKLMEYNLNSLSGVDNFVQGTVKDKFTEEVASKIGSLKNTADIENIDFFGAGKYFNRLCHKKWQQYLEVNSFDNYIDGVKIITNIDFKGKI